MNYNAKNLDQGPFRLTVITWIQTDTQSRPTALHGHVFVVGNNVVGKSSSLVITRSPAVVRLLLWLHGDVKDGGCVYIHVNAMSVNAVPRCPKRQPPLRLTAYVFKTPESINTILAYFNAVLFWTKYVNSTFNNSLYNRGVTGFRFRQRMMFSRNSLGRLMSKTKCRPNGTKLYWPTTWRICYSMECYRRRQTPASITMAPLHYC